VDKYDDGGTHDELRWNMHDDIVDENTLTTRIKMLVELADPKVIVKPWKRKMKKMQLKIHLIIHFYLILTLWGAMPLRRKRRMIVIPVHRISYSLHVVTRF
jgi:quinol-cytochrome oxidoreductase complex cytochrome b subunit